jgi:hypothetical protein
MPLVQILFLSSYTDKHKAGCHNSGDRHPLIGLLDEPIKPTMRDETVTKKAPKMTTSNPSNKRLPILFRE